MIISIDTAFEEAAVSVSDQGKVLACRFNERQADHASWVHTAILEVLNEAGVPIRDVQGVAVAGGPGSYTGIRVGMATAKGICFSLGIPLITESTLLLTAYAVRRSLPDNFDYSFPLLFSPMVDARRMEVFTTLYDRELHQVGEAGALVLETGCFSEQLEHKRVVFCGNGSVKWRTICSHPHAVFSDTRYDIADLASVASEKYKRADFADLAYTEPAYLKNVYTGTQRS